MNNKQIINQCIRYFDSAVNYEVNKKQLQACLELLENDAPTSFHMKLPAGMLSKLKDQFGKSLIKPLLRESNKNEK